MSYQPIPVIDIFAGPGGLSEGFSRYSNGANNASEFDIKLSIEKDIHALETLRLRSFFRHAQSLKARRAYRQYLKGEISKEALFASDEHAGQRALSEVLDGELGEVPALEIHGEIDRALEGQKNPVLIGGPPCQAYSLAGRSRMLPVLGEELFSADPRHQLYKEYLRILAVHEPIVFVFENVRGLLSSKINGESVFSRIREDLMNPSPTVDTHPLPRTEPKYTLFSVTERAEEGEELAPKQFVVKSENYGVPQNRHRVIILGVRNDYLKRTGRTPRLLKPDPAGKRRISEVIDGLPRLRSSQSRPKGDFQAWISCLRNLEIKVHNGAKLHEDNSIHSEILKGISDSIESASVENLGTGTRFINYQGQSKYSPIKSWYRSGKSRGITNHETRGHMSSDLERYLFSSVYSDIVGRTPSMKDFPDWLLPAHKNLNDGRRSSHFADRFRVQVKSQPATTITSHISKDGHYFIHFDPSQCRSLTVREAARIQTFPDDYHFEGPRTEQYSQVGNAVPPYLAYQIAGVVSDLLSPS